MEMKKQEFYDFCQNLYSNWLQGTPLLNEYACDFETDFLPEPYFRLPLNGNQYGKNCLYVLNYNPGHSLPMQNRQRILEGFQGKDYSAVSDEMGRYYGGSEFAQGKRESAAARRNRVIRQFALHGGFDSIMCVETFFLHSANFDKKRFLEVYQQKQLVKDYHAQLKNFLSDKPVLAIATIGGQHRTIDAEAVNGTPWLAYQQSCLGTNLKRAARFVIETAHPGSAVFFVEGQKYMSYMVGSNNIPRLSEENYRNILGAAYQAQPQD